MFHSDLVLFLKFSYSKRFFFFFFLSSFLGLELREYFLQLLYNYCSLITRLIVKIFANYFGLGTDQSTGTLLSEIRS